MGIMRGLSIFLIGLAAVNLGYELYRALIWGRDFRLLDTGEVWAGLHRESLLTLQPAVERYLTPVLWDPVILTVLTTPLTPMSFILGAFLFIASSPRLRF